MPDWNPRVNDLFLKALDRPPAERPAFLAAECGADDALRKAVETLLAAHEQAGNFLSDPYTPDGTATFDARTHSRGATPSTPVGEAGQLIAGRYKLVERIGEGGMGAVWMADQTEPVKRKVAVKLIKAGLDSKQVLARFEAERQALALMDHPNIAKVLDGGVHDGRPYFVMELVKGVPITEYCDARKLTPQQRLELFVPVCQALQHAHQKGIIHRDVKPANVLVALYDDRPVPKVIDFGVAKATGPTLTEHTLNTGFGGVVGTPQYMSPEQATFNNLDIDTRSDVYSLGILLYELLAGSPPFKRQELEKRGLLEILRVVREDEPPKPSTKLSTADALPSLSASRGMEPKKLTGLLRNELDWIVMKALEKDRTRRYETANGFAADVQRYLAGEPVVAVPPSVRYRLKKFVRKNKGSVTAGGVVFLTLLLGIAGTTFGLFRAEQAKQRESERADGERAAKDEAVAAQGKAVAAAAAEKAARQKAVEFRDKALDALRATTGDDVEKLIGEKNALTANEKAYLEAIARRWQVFAQQEGDDEQSRAVRAEGAFRVGLLRYRLGQHAEARPLYERALEERQKLMAEFPANTRYQYDVARSLNNLALLDGQRGARAEAERLFRAAVPVFERLAGLPPPTAGYRQDLARCQANLGQLLSDSGRDREAEQWCRQALRVRAALAAEFPADPATRFDLCSSHNQLALLHNRRGEWAEAENECREALAGVEKLAAEFPTMPDYAAGVQATLSTLGLALTRQGRHTEAERTTARALEVAMKLTTDYPAVATYRHSLASGHNLMGIALYATGRAAEAREHYRRALTVREKLAADFPAVREYRSDLGGGYCNLGLLLSDDGQPAESLSWFGKAVDTLRAAYRADPQDTTARNYLQNSYAGRAMAYSRLHKHAEAAADWDRVIDLSPGDRRLPFFRAARTTSKLPAGQVVEAVAEVAELRTLPGWNAGQLYNFACVYAVASGKLVGKQAEYTDAAMDLLTKAVKAGYKDAAHMQADTDLNPLRDRDDFKKLLADLEAKFPPGREVLPPPRRE